MHIAIANQDSSESLDFINILLFTIGDEIVETLSYNIIFFTYLNKHRCAFLFSYSGVGSSFNNGVSPLREMPLSWTSVDRNQKDATSFS